MAFPTLVSRISTTIDLNSPPFVCPAQTHTAGNFLVVVMSHYDFSPQGIVTKSVTNTAGDTFFPTTQTPWIEDAHIPSPYGDNHTQEIWYCPSTAGHVSDIITITFTTTGMTNLAIGCYEFNFGTAGLHTGAYSGVDGGVAYNQALEGPFVTTPVLLITQPSVVVAVYRNAAASAPTSPSGTQFSTMGPTAPTVFDSYQFTSVSGAAFCTLTGLGSHNGGMLAAVFAGGGPQGCYQDLPHAVSTGGSGCASDVPNV
jgi:hypothetical protein